MATDMKTHFREALPFQDFLGRVQENRDLWHRIHDRARVPPIPLSIALNLDRPWYLLAIGADWCMDSTNVLPWVARLAESTEKLDMRVLSRDDDPGLLQDHLTNGAEAIPILLILDQDHEEAAWWGPRPAGLKAFFDEELSDRDEDVRLAGLRGWYARDQGQSVLQEVLARLEEL